MSAGASHSTSPTRPGGGGSASSSRDKSFLVARGRSLLPSRCPFPHGAVVEDDDSSSPSAATTTTPTDAVVVRPLLHSSVPLSLWGGVDPATGIVVDRTHPLRGASVSDAVLCLPSSRGSCTASQVLLELILNGKSPRAVVTRDVDGILCVGALVAREAFGDELKERGYVVPDVICVGESSFDRLGPPFGFGTVLPGGTVVAGTDEEEAKRAAAAAAVASAPPAPGTAREEPSPNEVELTPEERSILDGSTGTAAQRVAMRIVTALASILEAPSLLPVTRGHVDGCTYVGPGGLAFVRKLVELNGKVVVPTTLNSVSADRRRWNELRCDPVRSRAANAVGDAYLELGCEENSFTCAPYLLPNPPSRGEQIVWGESNAVVYANSILGSRTEKYADYLDVCAALVGKVPRAGVHLDENRTPGVVLDASDLVRETIAPALLESGKGEERPPPGPGSDDDVDSFFPTFGYLIGNLSDGRVPLVLGLEGLRDCISDDDLKAFCAAFGTTGTAPLVHLAGITPEATDGATVESMRTACQNEGGIARVVTIEDMEGAYRALDHVSSSSSSDENDDGRVDLIALGNPHLSLAECSKLASLVVEPTTPSSDADAVSDPPEEKMTIPRKHPDVRVVATLSRHVYDAALRRDYVPTLETFGVEFVNDTCWCMILDSPVIPEDPNGVVATNSGKYAHYGPGLTDRRVRFGSLRDCVAAARAGRWGSLSPADTKGLMPSWLNSNGGTSKRGYHTAGRTRHGSGNERGRILSTGPFVDRTAVLPPRGADRRRRRVASSSIPLVIPPSSASAVALRTWVRRGSRCAGPRGALPSAAVLGLTSLATRGVG